MKPTRSVRVGRICKNHPAANGLRYEGNNNCVECAKESSRKHYASLDMTPAQKITTLLGEVSRLKVENEALRLEKSEPCDGCFMADAEALRKESDRLQKATAFVQRLCDSAGSQPSVATGYLHDILSMMRTGDQP